MATATVVPDRAVEPLPKELGIGIPGTKDAWARMDRDIILNATRQSLCFTEQMYWFLILTSRCGPTVRDGCFLRDHRGYVVRDQHGQEIPVRQKHVCDALQVGNRSLVHKTLRRLVEQKRVIIGDDGIWYPVMDAARLAELLAAEPESETDSQGNKKRKTHYIGIKVPEELYSGDDQTVTETIAGLEKIQQDFDTEHARFLKQHRERLKQYISDRRIIIDEKIEEIREEEVVVSQSVHEANGHQPTDRLTEIAAVIPSWLTDKLHEIPSPELLSRVAEALKDAPLLSFLKRIELREKSITSLGLLVGLARDVSEVWDQTERRKEQQRQEQEAETTAAAERIEQMVRYEEWQEEQISRRMAEQYPEGEPLETAVSQQLKVLKQTRPDWFSRMPASTRREVAIGCLRGIIRESLPSIAEYSCETG